MQAHARASTRVPLASFSRSPALTFISLRPALPTAVPMASASSDDDGHSFGSEPDFAAMSSLRLVEDDPGPSGTHVFDEIHDDAPRDFGHELEVADGERLRAALEAFEDAVYDDGAGGASSANDPGSGPVAAAGGARANPASARAKPRRVHADRQTTRPVLEQARECAAAPHLRVRGARVASAPREVFGRRVCGRADGRHAARAGERAAARGPGFERRTTTPRRGAWTRRASGGARARRCACAGARRGWRFVNAPSRPARRRRCSRRTASSWRRSRTTQHI